MSILKKPSIDEGRYFLSVLFAMAGFLSHGLSSTTAVSMALSAAATLKNLYKYPSDDEKNRD